MQIEELEKHCQEQIEKLPKTSKMYEEHLLTLSIINASKQYLNENERLLELCMFALLPKKIYNHELSIKTKEDFKKIIKNNLKEDTWTIREEIVKCWNNIETK